MTKKAKAKKTEYVVVVDCEYTDILDAPELGSPKVCQVSAGTKLRVVSKPNKKFTGVGVSNSVVGFIEKKYIK